MKKDIVTITKKQWDKIPKDYKGVANGIKMCFLGCIQVDGGTVLVPVEIKKETATLPR